MNLQETGAVLAKAAAIDNRDVGEATVLAWHETLDDIDYRSALRAVTIHRRTSDEYLMPIHIRRIVATLVPELIAELRRQPECEHGEPGGDQLHPTGGEPLCVTCRFRERNKLRLVESA